MFIFVVSNQFFRCAFVYGLLLGITLFGSCNKEKNQLTRLPSDGALHVYEGESIQQALDIVAKSKDTKRVVVHSGVYAPSVPAQAFIYFNAKHDGIILEADGEVTLTAANPQLANRSAPSYPAIVNHIVYFGDGISRQTVLRGFKITGANNFITRSEKPYSIETLPAYSPLNKREFFYSDGGGIKIFGRSSPTIDAVTLFDNYASPCAGGLSIEQQGFNAKAPLVKNSIFRNNRCQVTGSAIDVLAGSSVVIDNCLFINNIANTGVDFIGQQSGHEYNKMHGSGALTVFPKSTARVNRCTFTGNWNGVDDKGIANVYHNCIFWENTARGGISKGNRYEIDIRDGSGVQGCYFQGEIDDLRNSLNPETNVLAAPNPQFDVQYIPLAKEYSDVGFRPTQQKSNSKVDRNEL